MKKKVKYLLTLFCLLGGMLFFANNDLFAGCGVVLEDDCTITWARDLGDGSCVGNCGGCFYIFCL